MACRRRPVPVMREAYDLAALGEPYAEIARRLHIAGVAYVGAYVRDYARRHGLPPVSRALCSCGNCGVPIGERARGKWRARCIACYANRRRKGAERPARLWRKEAA